MANDIASKVIDAIAPRMKRANFDWDNMVTTSADFGFGKVVHCSEVLAHTGLTFDMRSAISTNPTVTPLLSRAKVQYTAWWIPTRLYVPALRDGVQVKAGKNDYAFPTINFPYENFQRIWSEMSVPSSGTIEYQALRRGDGFPYIPSNSIFTSLGMWAPDFDPFTFVSKTNPTSFGAFPEAKNAIPLLGYYDIFRNYFMNTQDRYAPIRLFSSYNYGVLTAPEFNNGNVWRQVNYLAPADAGPTRDDFDEFFRQVRALGSNYPESDGFDITVPLSDLLTPIEVVSQFESSQFAGRGWWPYRCFYKDGPGNPPVDERVPHIPIKHYGEWRTTYLNDYFTAFLSNENVEFERSTARVQLGEDNTITMEQIYTAQRVQNFIRRTVFKNSDYAEYIDAQYGVKPRTDITKPMFLGAISSWLSWNDVVSTTAQPVEDSSNALESNSLLGSRASLGFGMTVTGRYRPKKERPFIRFETKEPGYFMVIQTIVPEVSYYRGFDPMYSKRSLGSLYYPSFDKDGYQDAQMQYLVEQPARTVYPPLPGEDIDMYPNYLISVNFINWNVAYAQQPAWFEYMAKYNRLDGDFVDEGIYLNWTFHRGDPRFNDQIDPEGWVLGTPPIDYYSSTYVQPELFNNVFANSMNIDNIQCFFNFDINVYQPMSHRILSF